MNFLICLLIVLAVKALKLYCITVIGDITVSMQVDNYFTAYADGKEVGKGNAWTKTDSFKVAESTDVFAMIATNTVSIYSRTVLDSAKENGNQNKILLGYNTNKAQMS